MANLRDRLQERIIRAARLDSSLYEEVEADTGAMQQAMAVVILSSLAAGLGLIDKVGISGMFMGAISALIGWFLWAYLTFLIGTKLLPEPQTKADAGEMLRTIGFASSPGLIRVLAIIPGLSQIIFLVASVWMLLAMITAVKQALDYQSSLRALGVCFIGWLVQTVILAFLVSVVGISPAG